MSAPTSRRSSLTFRLTLLFASASTVVLLALGLLIAHFVESHFVELDRMILAGRLGVVRQVLQKISDPGELAAMGPRLGGDHAELEGIVLRVVAPDGRTLLASADVPFPRGLLEGLNGGARTLPITWTHGGRPYRGMAESIMVTFGGGSPVVAAVATDISHHREFQRAFRWTLGLFVGAAALLTGLLAWLSVDRGLGPLHAMSERASAVTASRLDLRLPMDAVPVELEELAAALNRMLERLEDSFRRLSEVSSDMAHELRTPVTALMTQTQVTLSRDRDAADYREVLAANAEQLDRLARMISEMLFLAQADNGLVVPVRESVDLGREVDELFAFYEALAEEKAVRLRRSGEGNAHGDRLMLRRALSNLLSNAIRHASPGGEVVVGLRVGEPGAVEITVENPGAVIAPENLTRIFDRFYRVDPSRQREGEGAGLGLAITRSIVRAHGGNIGVTSADGRTRFSIRLPLGER